MPPLVVADTTPLNYLVLIGRVEILGSLFVEVLVPRAVWQELHHPRTPVAVSRWLQAPPAWLRVVDVQQVDATLSLGAGENEAISLALEKHVSVLLVDERKGAPRDIPAVRKCREALDAAGAGLLWERWIWLWSCWLGIKRTSDTNPGQVEQKCSACSFYFRPPVRVPACPSVS